MSLVAVHIVTYNSEKTIVACLDSIKKQTTKEIELLLVDNASIDDTVRIVQKRNVRIIRNTKNIGYAAAHNQALRETQSTYVVTLNPDVVLDEAFLEEIISALKRAGKRTGSASGLLLRGKEINSENNVIDSAGLFMKRSRRAGLRYEGMQPRQAELSPRFILGPDGAAAVYKRAMLLDIVIDGEVFDEDFFAYKEDIDICWRACMRGWQSLFVPAARATHTRVFRPGQRSGVSQAIKILSVRNRYLLMLKNERIWDVVHDFPWIMTYELAILVYMLIRERASLRAYKEAFDMAPRILTKRLHIQAKRTLSGSAFRKALFVK